MYFLLLSFNFILSIMFMFMNHPLSMGLMLMIQTILISLITGFLSISFWFSYILFLIMIGGMLVLFIYMTSLASNEKFNLSMKMSMLFFFILLMFMLMMWFIDFSFLNPIFKNFNMNELFFFKSISKNDTIFSINMIYNYPNNMITLMLINYLFLTLIAVVKITFMNQGPIPQKF